MKKILLFIFFIPACVPAQVIITPVSSIGLHPVPVEVPAKFAGIFPSGKTVNIPPGYKARVFYAGSLHKPRFICHSPEGVLHIADMNSNGEGKILALPDKNGDGIADTAIVASEGYTNNHDIKFYNGNMYVTESLRVWKCTDKDQDGIYENKTVFIDGIGGGNLSGHVTRTIVFDSANHKLYLSIGSSCNVCRENNRAIIEQYNDDGTGKRIYATGIRNAVGMALHPETDRLWANNNGSDNQGNEIPPEWIDIVRDGGFYGHPFAYGDRQWFNFNAAPDYAALKPITSADSSRVGMMISPAGMIRAHSAPMAITFLNPSFNAFRYGMLLALHGSWNTTSPDDFRGYKVIYAHLESKEDTTINYVADFCTGFLTDSVNRVYWARPVGLSADPTGNLFISSDEGNAFILELYPDAGTGMQEPEPSIRAENIYPNPFHTSFTLPLTVKTDTHIMVTAQNALGQLFDIMVDEDLKTGTYHKIITWLPGHNGLYFLKIKASNGSAVMQKIYCNE